MKLNSSISIFIFIYFLCFQPLSARTIADYLIEFGKNEMPEINEIKDDENEQEIHVRAGQARALRAIEEAKYQQEGVKSVVVEIKVMKDNQGLQYLAGQINKADIAHYLKQMQLILGDRFDEYRQNQSARDHHLFHLTLVNPYEYQTLTDKLQSVGKRLRVQLEGLGRVSQGDHSAYFVVANSSDGQFIRQSLLLGTKDFHVTLGFDKKDVHGVAKDKTTLIKSLP